MPYNLNAFNKGCACYFVGHFMSKAIIIILIPAEYDRSNTLKDASI